MPTIESTVQEISTGDGVFKQGPNAGQSWERWTYKIDDGNTITTFDPKVGGVVEVGGTYEFDFEFDKEGRRKLRKNTMPRLVGATQPAAKPTAKPTAVPAAVSRDTSIRQAVSMKAAVEYVSRRLQPVASSFDPSALRIEIRTLVFLAFDEIDGKLNWESPAETKEEEEMPF